LECLKALLRVDKAWIPKGEGFSLYIRPTAISTHPFLGVSPPNSIKLFVINSPVGPYYPSGFKPVKLYADTVNVRAWPGGVGNRKVGGNYAPTILPQMEAAAKGYSQILWLYGNKDGGDLTEVGTMNLMVFWKNEAGEDELVTAPLDGTILPGVTRDSVLNLARSWGEFKVTERVVTMGEFVRALEAKRVSVCVPGGVVGFAIAACRSRRCLAAELRWWCRPSTVCTTRARSTTSQSTSRWGRGSSPKGCGRRSQTFSTGGCLTSGAWSWSEPRGHKPWIVQTWTLPPLR
jgi:branched-subunit amino acid aminotransferase/4-amino-4-deoxychorismate lyase